MDLTKLEVSVRNKSGKGAARQLKATGMIPAVAYGKTLEPIALVVSPTDLKHKLSGEYGLNTVFSLDVDGSSFPALVADYQYHPVTRALIHADFKKIDLDKEIEVHVPLEITGKAKGVTAGGVLQQPYRTVAIRALPLSVPVKIVHDITSLDIGEVVTVADVKCPEGVALTLPAKRTLVGIYATKRRENAEGEEGAEKTDPKKPEAKKKPA